MKQITLIFDAEDFDIKIYDKDGKEIDFDIIDEEEVDK